jgi:adenine deaminase
MVEVNINRTTLLKQLAAAIPKVELHVHLEGTLQVRLFVVVGMPQTYLCVNCSHYIMPIFFLYYHSQN